MMSHEVGNTVGAGRSLLESCLAYAAVIVLSLAAFFAYPVTSLGLRVDRDDMGPRVAARVAAMMAMGFLDEVRSLLDEPAGLSRTARQALGYRQLLAHLDGSVTLDEAVCDTIGRTRQFAVRQERWFRRDPRIEWVDAPERGGRAASETRSLARSIAGRLEAT